MLAAVCDVHDVLPQRGQLHLHHLWQLLWQHPAPCHRFVWVHWSCLLLWSPKVVKILFSTTWNPQFIQIFPFSGSVRTSSWWPAPGPGCTSASAGSTSPPPSWSPSSCPSASRCSSGTFPTRWDLWVDMNMRLYSYCVQAWDAATGSAVQKSWPSWVYAIIVILIGMSIVWIPVVALLQ